MGEGHASAVFPRVSQFSKIPIFSIQTNDLNELPHRAVDIVQLHFLTKIKNMCKKYIRRGHSMPVPLTTQAFVPTGELG